ncbi:MAG: glycogen synthase [Acidimicrobiia bacterium]
MKVLFATAELTPLVSVGGLAEASSGVVKALRELGTDVEVVIPDYEGFVLKEENSLDLYVPTWASPASARSGFAEGFGEVTAIDVPGIKRPNPYVDDTGMGWPDNADRFFAFSAAVAALADVRKPDVVHLNDWHTAAVLGLMNGATPTVLTIHTLGHQGWTSAGWLDRLEPSDAFERHSGTNPLAGAIALADAVVAVSPNYANEIRTPQGGEGLDKLLNGIGDRLVGIRNGIDTTVWDPMTDDAIPAMYSADDSSGKETARSRLIAELGWEDDGSPIIGMVTRLVDQKGVEFALECAEFARGVPFKLVVLGSGDQWRADWARHEAANQPDRIWFHDGFDPALAHRIFAGADLLLMPSRFEPCGLAQMQAMAYGTIPIVAPVGGLVDTVRDADSDRKAGTGFIMDRVDTASTADAIHRAVRAWKQPRRRAAIQRRGMEIDWSWREPSQQYLALYDEVLSRN